MDLKTSSHRAPALLGCVLALACESDRERSLSEPSIAPDAGSETSASEEAIEAGAADPESGSAEPDAGLRTDSAVIAIDSCQPNPCERRSMLYQRRRRELRLRAGLRWSDLRP
jgi:hypothetical protein